MKLSVVEVSALPPAVTAARSPDAPSKPTTRRRAPAGGAASAVNEDAGKVIAVAVEDDTRASRLFAGVPNPVRLTSMPATKAAPPDATVTIAVATSEISVSAVTLRIVGLTFHVPCSAASSTSSCAPNDSSMPIAPWTARLISIWSVIWRSDLISSETRRPGSSTSAFEVWRSSRSAGLDGVVPGTVSST